MNVARVNPIGLVEYPAGYSCRPQSYSISWRLATILVLAVFLVVGVTTTVASFGFYCLTSQAGASVVLERALKP